MHACAGADQPGRAHRRRLTARQSIGAARAPATSGEQRLLSTAVIPLSDSLSSRSRPIVTQVLIGACVVVFLYELTLRGGALDLFVERWGAVPPVVLGALFGDPRVPRWDVLTLFTSQ